MCVRHCYRFRCEHRKFFWWFCPDGCQPGSDKIRPCAAALLAVRAGKDDVKWCRFDHCCSTRCCQDDINERVGVVEDIERAYGIAKGAKWNTRERKNLESGPTLKSYDMYNAKQKIESSVRQHFNKCLLKHITSPGDSIISNTDLTKWGKLPRDPLLLQLPDRPEIDASDRLEYQEQVEKWRVCKNVQKDREIFKNWQQGGLPAAHSTNSRLQPKAGTPAQSDDPVSGSADPTVVNQGRVAANDSNSQGTSSLAPKPNLTQERQRELIDTFAQLSAREFQSREEVIQRQNDLVELRTHLQTLQPRCSNPQFHALEYAMQMPVWTGLHLQMDKLVERLKTERNAGRLSDDEHVRMEGLRQENQYCLDFLRTDFNDWLATAPPVIKAQVQLYQQNLDAFLEARGWYFARRQLASLNP